MAEKRLTVESLRELSKNLARLSSVNKYGDEETWGLADDFVDLEKSFLPILEDFFPKLLNDNLSPEDLENVLFDIGDEFRHIAYHIGRSSFYRYLSISSPELELSEELKLSGPE